MFILINLMNKYTKRNTNIKSQRPFCSPEVTQGRYSCDFAVILESVGDNCCFCAFAVEQRRTSEGAAIHPEAALAPGDAFTEPPMFNVQLTNSSIPTIPTPSETFEQ